MPLDLRGKCSRTETIQFPSQWCNTAIKLRMNVATYATQEYELSLDFDLQQLPNFGIGLGITFISLSLFE